MNRPQTMRVEVALDYRIDARGFKHGRARSDARIVSLVPSLTELLCDLGLTDRLVGRTGFCIHPKDVVKSIAKLGGTKDVDVEALRALEPSHVILNIDENRRELFEELESFVENIIVTHPQTPRDNLELFDLFGFVFNREREATELVESFTREFDQITAELAVEPVNVLYLIWRDPWMSVSPDTYIARMLELINWTTQPREAAPRYPEVAIEDFVGAVDRVLLSSEPYPFRAKHLDEVRAVFGDDVHVDLVDGEQLSWYGSRAITGLRYLRQLQRNSLERRH